MKIPRTECLLKRKSLIRAVDKLLQKLNRDFIDTNLDVCTSCQSGFNRKVCEKIHDILCLLHQKLRQVKEYIYQIETNLSAISNSDYLLDNHIMVTRDIEMLVRSAAEEDLTPVVQEIMKLMALSIDCISVMSLKSTSIVIDLPNARSKIAYLFNADTFLEDLKQLKLENSVR